MKTEQGQQANRDTEALYCDVAIIGAGIAGLWTAHRLRQRGLKVILIEPYAVGEGQTVRSQGIIHGGLKYALTGRLSSASEAVADMPTVWRNCLDGTGVLDLTKAVVLSEAQYLWSTGSLRANVLNFFASKLLKSRVKRVNAEEFPSALKHRDFKGTVYRLNEPVLDIPSVLAALSEPLQPSILKVDPENGYQIYYKETQSSAPEIDYLVLRSAGRSLRLIAQYHVFTAGQGNEKLSAGAGLTPMQRRPLQMVTCTFKERSNPPHLYGHCIDDGATPRITVTTHPLKANKNQVTWYLGGQVAESGVSLSTAAQIAEARKAVSGLLPWVDLSGTEWDTTHIDRAEPKQADGKKPDSIHVEFTGNVCLAWPTKLALSPLLADKVVESLCDKNKAQENEVNKERFDRDLATLNWPTATIARAPWEKRN
jgi:hypothetical protein